jgi:acetyltransferase-like isoleucine patch superfamily enzyme
MSVRRAFYVGTLRQCSARCHIGFGVLISHRSAILEDNVYIGNYAMLGDAVLRRGCLIGSRTSILSQGDHHVMDQQGRWVTPDRPNLTATEIGEYAWIGEGAIVVAPVGRSAHVAAGTVVASHVPEYIMVAGNPARFVKRLFTPTEQSVAKDQESSTSSDVDR